MWLVFLYTGMCVLEDGLGTVDGKYVFAMHAAFSDQTYSVALH